MNIEKHILEKKDIQSRMLHWRPIFKIINTHHRSEDFCLALQLCASEGTVSIALQDEDMHSVVTPLKHDDMFSDFINSSEQTILIPNTASSYKSISTITSYAFCWATKIIIEDKLAGLLLIYTNTNESLEIQHATEINTVLNFFLAEIKVILDNVDNIELVTDVDLQKTINNVPHSIIATNRYEQIQYLNPKAIKLLDIAAAEGYDKKCTDLLKYYNRKNRKRCLDPIKITLQTGKPYVIPKDTIIINPTGTESCVEGFTIPIFDKQNVLKGTFLLMNDTSAECEQQTKKQESLARFDCEKKMSSVGYLKFDYRKNKIDLDANSSLILLGSDKFTTFPITDFFTRLIDHEKNNELTNMVEKIERYKTPISEEILSIHTLTNEKRIVNYRLQNTFDAAGKLISQEGIVSYLNEETILRNTTSLISNSAHIYFLRYIYKTGQIEFHSQLCQLLNIEPSDIQSLDQMLELVDEYDRYRFIEWLESLLLDKQNDGIIINFITKDQRQIPIYTQRYYSGLQNSDQNALFLVFQDLRHIYDNPDFIEYTNKNASNSSKDLGNDNTPITHLLDVIEKALHNIPSDEQRIKIFLRHIAIFFKTDKIELFLQNEETQQLEFHKEWHNKANSRLDIQSLPFRLEEIPNVYKMLQQNENVVIEHIDDIQDEQKADWEFFKRRATNSVLAIPVFLNNQLLAVIFSESESQIKTVRDSYLKQIALYFALLAKQSEHTKQNTATNDKTAEMSAIIDALPHSFCIFDKNATLEQIHLNQRLLTLAKENEIKIDIETLNQVSVQTNVSTKIAELIRQITNEQYTSIQTNIKVEIKNQEYIFEVECSKTTSGTFLCMFSLLNDDIANAQKSKNQKLKKAFSLAAIGDWSYMPEQEEFIASYETATHLGFTQELKDGYKINFKAFTKNVVTRNKTALMRNITQLYSVDEILQVNKNDSPHHIYLKAQWYETINNKLMLQGISQDITKFMGIEHTDSALIQTMQSITDEVFILSENLEIVYANNAAVNSYASAEKGILNLSINDVLTYIDEQIIEQIKSIQDNKTIAFSIMIENAQHIQNDIHLSASNIQTNIQSKAQTSYLLIIKIEKSITKQISAGSKQKYQQLYPVFNNMPCPIIIVNNEKRIIYINTEAIHFFADNFDPSGLSNAQKCITENAILPKKPNILYNETGILNYAKNNISREIPYRFTLLEEENNQERDFILMLDCGNKEKVEIEVLNTNLDVAQDKKHYILIVDDLMENYILLKELIDIDRECKYYWAKNGQVAIDTIQTNPDIELILMDIDMPVMNGIEATRKIKAQAPHIPIIIQSAYSQANERNEAHKAGCDDFVAKPTDYIQLSGKIKKFLKIY